MSNRKNKYYKTFFLIFLLLNSYLIFSQQGTGIWTELHPKVPRVDYWGVYFVNKDTGLATGELGAIIKTTDGGNSWYNIKTNYNKYINAIGSYTGEKIIAAGDNGLIIISRDYGQTWETIQSGTNNDLWHMLMINEKLGWIVGFNSTLFKTTDGGNTLAIENYTAARI